MDRSEVEGWVAGYERAWRTSGTADLGGLFAPEVSYRPSPWAPPLVGLDELAYFWESEREGHDEEFAMDSGVIAVDETVAVVRVSVDYAGDDPSRWRDLWVLRFGEDGLCTAFEEWPFAPDQPDGH